MVAPIEGGDEEKVESQDNENAMMMCFGGLSTTPNIAPGNRWSETITVLNLFRILFGGRGRGLRC